MWRLRDEKMDQRITIEFKNCINLAEILNKYNHNDSEYVTMQIGYDGNIYILLNKNIPERIDGMFVPAESNSRFAVLVLQIDWHEDKIIQEKYYDLGVQKMNYSFIQPIPQGFLLVAARCRYNKGNPDKNASVIDHDGNMIREFCIGDGISQCLFHPELGIITGYFDEGIFGNYGWKEPLGAYGVRVWGIDGQDIWKADKQIYDCYAMNVSGTGDIWYYYYDEFKLVKANINGADHREYVPEIKGAESIIISEDEAALIMDKGYDADDEFAAKKILYDKLGDEIPVLFKYKGIECRVGLISSYGSKAVFMENWKHMFIRSFQSLCTD